MFSATLNGVGALALGTVVGFFYAKFGGTETTAGVMAGLTAVGIFLISYHE